MVQKIQLRNGLKVLFLESKRAPVVSVQMWVKTGSADEKTGEEGISHFIEHLVFKGTEKFKVGEIASYVEGSGGELNAYTSFDQTVFYVTISKQYADVALDTISQMMGFPTFDPVEIDNEREVVCEEIKRSNDSPSRQSSQLLFSTFFKNHAYGIPVIGYEKNIREFSPEKIKKFFDSRYVPRNMTLLVVGDFDSKQMKLKVEEYFGRFKDRKVRSVKRTEEKKKSQVVTAAKKVPYNQATLNIAWPIPDARHKDVPALDILAMILGHGDGSRLAQSLRIEEPLTNYVGTSSFTPQDDGFLYLTAGYNAENLEAILDKISVEIMDILTAEPKGHELLRVLTSLEGDEFYNLETVDGLSNKIGSFNNLFNDPDYFKTYLAQIRKVTLGDLLKVAQKYLSGNFVVTANTNREEAEVQQILETWAQDLKAGIQDALLLKGAKPEKKPKNTFAKISLKKSKSAIELEKVELSSGATVILRTSHDIPTLSLQAVFRGGSRKESPELLGLTEAMASVWSSGAKSLSEIEIIQKTEGMASHISSTGGKNSVRLALDCLTPFQDESIGLFEKLLCEPSFPEDLLEREKTVLLDHVKSRMDNPNYIAAKQFMQTLFESHPYGRETGGNEETLKKITRKDVLDHWQKMFFSKNLVIAACGDFDKDKLLKKLESITSQMPKGQRLSDNFSHAGPKLQEMKYSHLDREQTHIIYGYKGISLSDPDRYPLMIIQSVLAGQGGRLFINLRDKASLAYSISPMRMDGIETGYFGAYIGCSPEKAEKAISMIEVEFDKMKSQLVPEDEIERAKKYLVGRHDIDLQRNASFATSMVYDEIYGIDYQETFRFSEKVRAVDPRQVQKVAQQIFSQPAVISVVGSRAPSVKKVG